MNRPNSNASRRALALAVLGAALAVPTASPAQVAAPGFHFFSICRSDAAVSKNTVTVVLHGPDASLGNGTWSQVHAGLPDVTINVLWTYVDYRQNHAVFKYRQASCTTDAQGSCTFHGGSGRARWQLAEVVGYEMSAPAFETAPTTLCPNTLMIDFW